MAVACLLCLLCAVTGARGSDDAISGIAAANNAFAFDLYARVKSHGGNLFISPYSISTALAMTSAGALGRTAAQMATVLHLPEGGDSQALLGQLIRRYQADSAAKGYELHVADALWTGTNGIHLNPQFVRIARDDYGAQVTQIPFAGHEDQAAKNINDWVADHTGGKIKDLIPPSSLNDQTKLVLTNAIYFKGSWETPFNQRATHLQPWHSPDGDHDVPMMHRTGLYRFYDDGAVKALGLSYKGGDLEMLALLPDETAGIGELERSLDSHQLDDLSEKLASQQVEVSIPRFHMESRFDLSSPLQSMGMADAFSGAADFSGIDGQHDLQITAVVHKAYVDVDEEGTVAAGATGVIVGAAAMIGKPAVFNADHPFLLLIRDVREKTILFMGRLTQPAP